MEAELFGYEKGAFTGAVTAKEGRVELAHQGTLFLDEIATLTLPLQSKLLRVLEDRSLTRLGGKKSIKVDFRLISATNEDLGKDGPQRPVPRGPLLPDPRGADFVPALRERVDDIPVLAEYFTSIYSAANGIPPKRIADDAMLALKRIRGPGTCASWRTRSSGW